MIKSALAFYPRARQTGHRMVIIHSGERILNELDARLAEYAQKKLRARGVEILLNTKTTEATAEGVLLSSGEIIPAGTVICTVGNAPHPLVAKLPLPQDRGRILVEESLSVKGCKNVWALGDSALIPDVKRGGFCPQTAQYAGRQGRQCALNVVAAIQGRPVRSFQFEGLGQLAVLGRHFGVAQVWGWTFAGFLAWVLWRAVYLAKLPGLRCKIRVGFDWVLDVLFPRDIAKIEVQRTEGLRRAHFRQGEVIIRQGEIGDRFYIIASGEVEVLHEEPGKPAECLRVCSTGDTLGEIALLKNAPRTATVRCLTPVDVVTFNRGDFLKLVGSYDAFRTDMERYLPARPWPEHNPGT